MKRIHPLVNAGMAALVVAGCTASQPDATPETIDSVSLTWLSVTNWLLEAGDTRILFDGYVSRVDRTTVNADGSSTAPARLDTTAVRRVRDAVPGARELDWILVGHGHWDHAFDTPAWTLLTDARVAGARSVCHLVVAYHENASCMAVDGGETIELGPGISTRVVRWHHSGDSLTETGRRLRAPLELREPPALDPATGGLRPGFLEDFPNGGGSRAYLVTIETRSGPITLFWSNTANPQAWDSPVPPDTAFFREQGIETGHLEWAASDFPTRHHLEEAVAGAGVGRVDLWIGFGDADHFRQVTTVLPARVFAPHHWDDFWMPIIDGPGGAFRSDDVATALDEIGTRLLVPEQYFDRIILTPDSAWIEDGQAVRRTLGVSDSPG